MVKFVLCLLAAVFLVVPAAEASDECLICHGAMQGKMQGSKGVVEVHVDADRFVESVHGVLGCTVCHMGYGSGPHSATAEVPDEIASLAGKVEVAGTSDPVAMSACSGCHPDVYEEYTGSIHGKNIFEKKQADGPLCTDCHGSPHYMAPQGDAESEVNFANMVESCGRCHEDEHLMEKYGVNADVIEEYKHSFHGKKYVLGHTKVPVCNDCHGAHGITTVDAPGSAVTGEGKVATCGKCHEGATAKFAAAPAHTHVGKDNPIPYYSAKGLTALVIGTFLFIFVHVLLDMYAETRDRLSGKKKGGH
jgi:hypothetical protein